MPPLTLVAVLLSLASLFGVINHRILKLPNSIGVMVVALFASFCALGVDHLFPHANLKQTSEDVLGTRELPQTLLNGALCFLLFAGALEVEIKELWQRKITVLLLATIGVLVATALFAAGIWAIFHLVGLDVPFAWCVVLGALLAPTDPVTIAGMLAGLGLPKNLRAVIAGESLFNDGVGVVVFTAAISVAADHTPTSVDVIALELIKETGGGLILGAGLGWLAYRLILPIDDYPLEILISLALAATTYVVTNALGMSGAIGVVVAGLVIGHAGRGDAMSEMTERNLILFWSVIDELLNALLFLLLGFEILGLHFSLPVLLAAALAIPLALCVRAASIIVTVLWLHTRNPNRWPGVAALTWGGLRGGISVALALSLPQSPWRGDILFVCYAIVVFTIVVQGLTMQRVVKFFFAHIKDAQEHPEGI